MRTIKVVRFSLYPADEPTGYAVGFAYEANGRNGYIDTVVPLDEVAGKSSEEIVQLALTLEQPHGEDEVTTIAQIINEQLNAFEAKNPIIGLEINLV
jgi:hypothetical protein